MSGAAHLSGCWQTVILLPSMFGKEFADRAAEAARRGHRNSGIGPHRVEMQMETFFVPVGSEASQPVPILSRCVGPPPYASRRLGEDSRAPQLSCKASRAADRGDQSCLHQTVLILTRWSFLLEIGSQLSRQLICRGGGCGITQNNSTAWLSLNKAKSGVCRKTAAEPGGIGVAVMRGLSVDSIWEITRQCGLQCLDAAGQINVFGWRVEPRRSCSESGHPWSRARRRGSSCSKLWSRSFARCLRHL